MFNNSVPDLVEQMDEIMRLAREFNEKETN